MRSLILIAILALSGCGGSSDDDSLFVTKSQIPPNESAEVAALKVQFSAEQAQVNFLQQQMKSLQLIGQPKGVSRDSAGRILNAIGNAIDFGPCTTMGVMIGFTNSSGTPADALSAASEDFEQCTGYRYAVNVADGSISLGQRIFWDGPNCTGNLIEWDAAGTGYSDASLQAGTVFTSPADGKVYMVTSGQTPHPIEIQSVWVLSNPGCQADVETQLMYQVVPNDASISGIPDSGVGSFQLASP